MSTFLLLEEAAFTVSGINASQWSVDNGVFKTNGPLDFYRYGSQPWQNYLRDTPVFRGTGWGDRFNLTGKIEQGDVATVHFVLRFSKDARISSVSVRDEYYESSDFDDLGDMYQVTGSLPSEEVGDPAAAIGFVSTTFYTTEGMYVAVPLEIELELEVEVTEREPEPVVLRGYWRYGALSNGSSCTDVDNVRGVTVNSALLEIFPKVIESREVFGNCTNIDIDFQTEPLAVVELAVDELDIDFYNSEPEEEWPWWEFYIRNIRHPLLTDEVFAKLKVNATFTLPTTKHTADMVGVWEIYWQ